MIYTAADSTPCHGYAAHDAASPLRPHSFTRRALRPDDVRIEIQYCGVCHSDLHAARNDWRNTRYPIASATPAASSIARGSSSRTRWVRK